MMSAISLMIMLIGNDDDRALVTEIYLKYKKLMFAIAMKIVQDPHVAEDMVMAAIAEIIDNIEILREISCFRMRLYVATIIRNDSIDYVRKRNRHNRHSFLPTDETFFDNVASESEVDDTILQNAEMDVLRETLSRLPENERLLLTMKYVDESSDKEIAAILHIGQDSVRMYLSRARKHLLALFKEVEEDG